MPSRFFIFLLLLIGKSTFAQQKPLSQNEIVKAIRSDQRFDSIQSRALLLLKGFSAGTSYSEVWIRDLNTFINGSLSTHPKEEVKTILLMFFKAQGDDGNIVDGLVDTAKAHGGYQYRYSKLLPAWAGHKNTVETDQESSLIQAVYKYVNKTGDRSILDEMIGNKKVIERMEDALIYVKKDRWSPTYQLVTGATTIDWGDVQPEKGWGVAINDKTKWSVDIYDNAMFVIAINNFNALKPGNYTPKNNWINIAAQVKNSVRKNLWSASSNKYIPHIYLNGSPFNESSKEMEKIYTGGTICAIMAGFNTKPEIAAICKTFTEAAAKEEHATIGMTVYPPYSKEDFPNMPPYEYQNAGDWTWFGGRIAEALAPYDMLETAYEALLPMIKRCYDNKGFYEWYHVQTGKPKGSGDFRGEAGVLFDAINILKDWAAKH